MNYQRVSDASHVLSTEEALKHWDRRRPSTSHSSLELRNVSQMSARNDAMMRVSSKFILLQDWRLGSESRKLYGLPPRRISEWFPGWHTTRRFRSQLWPAIGRPLSLHAPLLHDLVRVVNPLVGAWITVLEKS